MENNQNPTKFVEDAIKHQSDFQLIEKLEFFKDFDSVEEYQNYILLILLLIQNSKWFESASTLLLKKTYKEEIFKNKLNKIEYGNLFIETLKIKAIFPYVRISEALRRLLTSIIYDVEKIETMYITEITPYDLILDTNIFFLDSYLKVKNIDKDGLKLYYNCIQAIDPNTRQIKISDKANSLILYKINNGGFISYLEHFIRPLYYSSSEFFEGDSQRVPEPFFLQIFGSEENFMSILNGYNLKENEDLIIEIKKFMQEYKKNSSLENFYVDIEKDDIKLTKKLHKLASLKDEQ
jgi:hypothetical protein